MNVWNSYPLNIDGLELVGAGAFAKHQWSVPSLTHLRSLMRHVFSSPDEAKLVRHNLPSSAPCLSHICRKVN